jgi:predicted DNA-binding transcriptional regulator AlpA
MPDGPEGYLKLSTVAKLFDVTPKTIRRWIEERGFPEPVSFGNVKLFRSVEVRQYQERALEERLRAKILGGIPGQTGTNRDTRKKAD